MKKLYISDILDKIGTEEEIELLCWVKSIRNLGGIIFLTLEDSTGMLEAYVEKRKASSKLFSKISNIKPESSIRIEGILSKKPETNNKELIITDVEIIGQASLNLYPRPRNNFNIFESKYVDYILRKRHLFIRNNKLAAVFKTKHIMLKGIREWLDKQGFIEIDTPILTQATLYDDNSTFCVDYFGTPVYLSQCAALYLGAAVHVFEKVYTITPAFRAEPSRSPRHNPEFWHVKGQIAFSNLEDIITFVENMIFNISKYVNKNCKKYLEILGVSIDINKLKPPYPRITFDEALEILATHGIELDWGKSIGADEEKVLSRYFETPFFVTYLPSAIEPFPYRKNPTRPETTLTADLLAPCGYGEILGVAEFIHKPDDLIQRMKEKGKYEKLKRFEWYYELKRYGSVPHAGFGMGVERLLRWLLKLKHVRDTFLFPRLYHRIPYP